jgi:hypothetical protein
MLTIAKRIYRRLFKQGQNFFPGSSSYWEGRYQSGGTSGSGSYNHLAAFKAEVINSFVAENNVRSVIEFGSGDGNQLALGTYSNYIGLDVSKAAIIRCQQRFQGDKNKSFYLYDSLAFVDNANLFKADVALSLDVIYHLIEDEVYNAYMTHLFNAAQRFVIIYSSNYDSEQTYHERNRKFTKWIEQNQKEWILAKTINNKYPEDKLNSEKTSKSDFYIFQRK